ncbi:MAG: hypothetical protein WC346_08365 [Methanogenium sp.]|jgi:hypothetical protein
MSNTVPQYGSYNKVVTETITTGAHNFYGNYGLDRIREHIIVEAAENDVYAGDPLVWKTKASNIGRVIKFGVVTNASTTTLTLTSGHKSRFAVGDLVWIYSNNGAFKEYLGPIVSIHATNQTMVVTEAPSITAGYLYVADSEHVFESTSTAAGLEKGADTSDTGLWYITIGSGETREYKVGDFIYEEATGGGTIKNLGPIIKIDHANNKLFVGVAPAQTSGGLIGGNGEFPEIIGIAYQDQPTDDGVGTTPTSADVNVTYVVDCVLLRNKMGVFTDSVDDELVKWVRKSLPMVWVTDQKDAIHV